MIHPRIQAIFLPVSDIAAARAWYARTFDFTPGPILHGHLSVIDLNGVDLILDAKLRTPEGDLPTFRAPAIMFPTDDVAAVYEELQRKGVRLFPIQSGHYFNLADPDGNVLMICKAR